jgi:hypothetical protein
MGVEGVVLICICRILLELALGPSSARGRLPVALTAREAAVRGLGPFIAVGSSSRC